MENGIKLKLERTTEAYKSMYPDDYLNVCRAVKEKIERMKIEDMSKQFDTIDRAIIEWPETLYNMVLMSLTDDEKKQLFKDARHSLIRWYARKYKEFALVAKV